MTATLKISPDRLPYRGEPTKEIRVIEEAPVRRDLNSNSPSWRFPTKEERVKADPRIREWTPEEDSIVWKMYYKKDMTQRQIGAEIGRTQKAVCLRLQTLRARKERAERGKKKNESTE